MMSKKHGAALVVIWVAILSHGCSSHTPAKGNPNLELRNRMAEGVSLYAQGKYLAAEHKFQQGFDRALQLRDTYTAQRFLNSVGGARFAAFRYKEAMRAFLEVRRLAQRAGDSEMLAMVSCNLSSLYLQQQDINAGARAAEETMAALKQAGTSKWGPLLRAQAAILHSRQGRFDLAAPLFDAAIAEADARGDVPTASLIWDQLGHELTMLGRADEAEAALLEAFRQRKLNRLPEVVYSYYTLGRLRLAQGDAAQADDLISKSIAGLAGAGGTLPSWRLYYERGRARLRARRLTDALQDFQRAREAARRVRLDALPAESIWVNTGVDQSSLSSDLIRAASTLYFRNGDPAYARLAFEVSEENRAASLRALVYSPDEWTKRLPPEYWESLARLRQNEAALLRSQDESIRSQSVFLQYRLTEMEAQAGLGLELSAARDPVKPGELMERVRRNLRQDEVLFSFHLGDPESAVWAVTRDGFRMVRLPSRTRIAGLIKRFREDIAAAGPIEAARSGEQLFAELFGSLPKEVLATQRWLLVLDGDLFQVPFAALVTGSSDGTPKYLAETHSSVIVPSVLFLDRRRTAYRRGDFVAVGDPIYNSADPRRVNTGTTNRSFYSRLLPLMFAAAGGSPGPELPRLAGSRWEIEACAGVMPAGSRRVILTGADATIRRLDESLKRRPAILHFATHFLRSGSSRRQALAALSLDRYGSPEMLGPVEIARRRANLDLVVLSGCSSGAGEALPAEGLMGMTRAWLAAGSRSVLATLWSSPDDQGQLLVAFYRHLHRLREKGDDWAAADALRMAQLEMMHSAASQSAPRRWGSYILAGRE